MNQIVKKRRLAENVVEFVIDAPRVAKNAAPGQFVILRVDGEGERIPFTICDTDKEKGTVTLLVQTVGYSTAKMAELPEGGYLQDFTGPLGRATRLSQEGKTLLVGGGIGTAVIFPQAKALHLAGRPADAVVGARTKALVMYEKEFRRHCGSLYIMTDDGSYGEKGFVTDCVKKLLDADKNAYAEVFAVGPLVMMKAVSNLTKAYGVKTVVSMNPIMVDGTGMCGGCRLTVNDEVKYACVDGPEFDGHAVDFDEALQRSRFYGEYEREQLCRLTGEKR
jgi:ferredoxin--NADP+ reductase